MRIKKENYENKIVYGDANWVLRKIPNESIDLVLTSPPYFGCREYDDDNSGLGREHDPNDYINNIVSTIHRIFPLLKNSGSLYLNLGDVYFGTKGFSRTTGKWVRKTSQQYKDYQIVEEDGKYLQHKQRLMLPERIAIILQNKGWILRNNIILEKLNPLPCHSKDRRLPVYENMFHFVKKQKYFFNYDRAKELNHHRDVIKYSVEPYEDHLATFPEKLISPFIETTCPENGIVLDPFLGSGTVAKVSLDLNRRFIGIELNKKYCELAKKKIEKSSGIFQSTINVNIVEVLRKGKKNGTEKHS